MQTTNIAVGKTATASSSDAFDYPSEAVDGNMGTRWYSNNGSPQWLRIDLGASYSITRVKINWDNYYSTNYRIEISNDQTTWYQIYAGTNASGQGFGLVNDITLLSGGSGRYIRMFSVTNASVFYGISINEIEVYGFTNLTLNKAASAYTSSSIENGNTAGFGPQLAFDMKGRGPVFNTDGSSNTTAGTISRWSSAYAEPQWVQVDLGAIYVLNRVKLSWEAAYATNYRVETSNDGNTWVQGTLFSNAAGLSNVVNDIIARGTGRYVRMYGLNRATTYGFSLFEMEMAGVPNTAPTVSISSPANGAVYTAPSTISLSATVNDAESNITKVEFYSGTTLLGTATASPYSINVNANTPGSYSITAKAYDAGDLATTSSAITVNINPAAPTVTGASRCGAGSVTVSAAGTPAGGTYNWYTVSSGGTAIAGATAASYSTPSLNATTTYYVSYTSGGRESARTAVTATINPTPTISSIPATGLIDSYLFSGNANDATGGNNNGILQGTTNGGPTLTAGRYGNGNNAYTFDGSDDYISTAVSYNNPGTFSLSIWFNTTVAGGKLIGFESSQTGSSGQFDRHIYMNNTGQLYFGVYPNQVKTINTTTAYNDGKWHHVVATLSATTGIKLYVDGMLQAQDASAVAAENFIGYWRIGAGRLVGWPGVPTNISFTGKIDDVVIFDREITQNEVANLNGAGASPNPLCAGSTINLTANTVSGATYSWTGPNGFTSNLQNPTISNATTAASGYYTVTVNVNGCSSQTLVAVLVNPIPTSTFVASPAELFSGENSTLTYTGTVVANAVYTWNFDGGMVVSGSGVGPYQLKWNTPGVKNVTLSVSANGCTSATQTVPVTVNGNYVWNGSVSSDWNTAANWAPNGVPGPNDAVTIVNVFNNAPVNFLPLVNAATTVKNFYMNSGTLNLNASLLKITGIADFSAGRVENGNLSIACTQVTFRGTTFTAEVNTICDNIYLNGSVFDNTATITKEGPVTTDNDSNGGSTFNGHTTIINNTSSRMRLGTTSADSFVGDVTFNNMAAGTLEVSYNSASVFAGSITVNSNSVVTFGAGTGTAVLNGPTDQNISKAGNAAVAFNRLTINKSAGNTLLHTPVTITSSLNLTQGKIISSSTNLLIFGAGTTVTGAKHTSYVEGPVQRYGPGAFTFPVGKTNLYRPIGINANGNATGAFVAEYFPVSSATVGSHATKDATIDHLSYCEYWQLNRVAGAAEASVTLSWDTNSCGVDVPGDLIVAHWNGAQWENEGSHNITGNTQSGTVTTMVPLATFSPFTLASSSNNNPLPVNLIAFKATSQAEKVELEWQTASEKNNKGFEIQRSTNGKTFTKVAFVPGAGTSTNLNNYKTYDFSPVTGISYYRLKQIDQDGKETYSRIVTVTLSIQSRQVQVTPNPVMDKATVKLHLTAAQTCIIKLADASGRIVYTQTIKITGSDKVILDMTNYSQGLYFITVQDSQRLLYQGKLMKEK